MPNFHVHWLVALGAIDAAPAAVRAGRDTYVIRGQELRTGLLQALRGPSQESVTAAVGKAVKNWSSALQDARHAVTCFSAYMLGACGPDLWTVPSPNGTLPATASYLFNLGHYNRTHRQFQVSVARQAWRPAGLLSSDVEQAYFSGMATHFAADLVVHQLVNVMAGAYNFLEKRWLNEQEKEGLGPVARTMLTGLAGMGDSPSFELIEAIDREPRLNLQEEAADSGLKKLWSMHNKVEHYWDTWARYRYLGDHGPVFDDGRDRAGRLTTLGLPTVEGLLRELKDPPAHVRAYLAQPETRYRLEKALCFPQPFCDRAVDPDGGLIPFIYQVVANGAYPRDDLHPELASERADLGEKESKDADGKASKTGGSERSKLDFFTSATNDASSVPTSWNYLAYFVCPDLAKVKRHAAALYDHAALEEFVVTASGVAGRFLQGLGSAYDRARRPAPGTTPIRNADDVHLGQLHGFWNLDTGHALRVRNLGNVSNGHAVTGLALDQVLGADAAAGGIDVAGARSFLAGKATVPFEPKHDDRGKYGIAPADPPTLLVNTSPLRHDGLFQAASGGRAAARVPSASVAGGPVQLALSQQVTVGLRLRIEQPRLGAPGDQLGWFLHVDSKQGLGDAVDQKAPSLVRGKPTARDMTEEWLEKARLVHAGTGDAGDAGDPSAAGWSTRYEPGAVAFTMPIRMDLPDVGPLAPGEPRYEFFRNFAFATGRTGVLHPTSKTKGPFDPGAHLVAYENVSPTEQVFFSLFVVVRRSDGKVVELISGKAIESQADYDRLRRIDAAGFVKVVLTYDSVGAGLLHLRTCWIDGLEVPLAQA